jgi:hypothetical protein
MRQTISIPFFLIVLISSPAFAQRAGEGAGDYGEERRWLAEHPDALKALGGMSREELGQFFQTYQGMSEQEKAQLREHSGELQQLGPAERNWALQNPDAVRQLGAMPEDERKKVVETYQKLTPEEQQKLRQNSAELGKMSPAERKWALENPDAMRQLGNVPDGERDQMIDAYRNLSPDAQRFVRDQMNRK